MQKKIVTLPPVSIILPSCNYEQYLHAAVESVLAQSHEDWELLIIDDGSTDGSAVVAEAFARRDGRIRFLTHPDRANRGLAATLLLGLAAARHAVAAFLEADDAWEPEALAGRLKILREPGTVLVFSAVRLSVDSGRDPEYYFGVNAILEKVVARRRPPVVRAHELVAVNLIPSFSCVMTYRDVLQSCDFAAPIPPLLDKWLWQQVALRGACRFLPEMLVNRRLHGKSYITEKYDERDRAAHAEWARATRRLLSAGRPKPSLKVRTVLWAPVLGLLLRILFKARSQGTAGLRRAVIRRLSGAGRL
jgi:glycosyltransferase involved in cell wall biosynthesis